MCLRVCQGQGLVTLWACWPEGALFQKRGAVEGLLRGEQWRAYGSVLTMCQTSCCKPGLQQSSVWPQYVLCAGCEWQPVPCRMQHPLRNKKEFPWLSDVDRQQYGQCCVPGCDLKQLRGKRSSDV